MQPEADPVEWLERTPDERLVGADLAQLPASVGEPPAPLPESRARRRVVRFGAAMTGASLIGGALLSLLGLVEVFADGSLIWFVVLVLGIALAATHWGWVHVAELTGNRIEAGRHAALEERRKQWLTDIEPYPRWEVSTSVADDGSITVLTVAHFPVPAGEDTYTFVREEVEREVHPADEPGAHVTERAELLRREAASRTREARERYETARAAYEQALMLRDDEQQRRAALRAASEALSERINSNLRDPPLTE
jgi:hypothetical protein